MKNLKIDFGDAIYETSIPIEEPSTNLSGATSVGNTWFNRIIKYQFDNAPFFYRGGSVYTTEHIGVLGFNLYHGRDYYISGFHSVLVVE